MSEAQELEIRIGADGEISVEVIGVKGGGCLKITQELEAALGEVVEREFKPSFYSGPGPDEVQVQG